MAKSKTTEAGTGAGASCSSSKSREKPLPIPNSVNFFSELEVNAIELLVQLSGSSCCNGGSTATEEESESKSKSRAVPPPHHDDQVSSSFSKYETLVSEEDREEVEDEDGASFGLEKKRFRPISDLYKLTEPLNLLKRKRRKMMSN